MNPTDAFELIGRRANMRLRVKKQCSRALKIAQRMRNELNLKVNYPGLTDHPQYKLLDSMRNKGYGFGGVLCIDMETTDKDYKLMTALRRHRFGYFAVSLGYYENLISCPCAVKSEDDHTISPGYIRISIGYHGTPAQSGTYSRRHMRRQQVQDQRQRRQQRHTS